MWFKKFFRITQRSCGSYHQTRKFLRVQMFGWKSPKWGEPFFVFFFFRLVLQLSSSQLSDPFLWRSLIKVLSVLSSTDSWHSKQTHVVAIFRISCRETKGVFFKRSKSLTGCSVKKWGVNTMTRNKEKPKESTEPEAQKQNQKDTEPENYRFREPEKYYGNYRSKRKLYDGLQMCFG